MHYQEVDTNELIAEELAFSKKFKLPSKEFMPREVIVAVRGILAGRNSEDSIRLMIRSIFRHKHSHYLSCIEEGIQRTPLFSAMFRNEELHVFKGVEIRERRGDVVIPQENIDEFMSVLIHEDWECEYEKWVSQNRHYQNSTNLTDLSGFAFTFDFKLLHYLRKDFIVSEDE